MREQSDLIRMAVCQKRGEDDIHRSPDDIFLLTAKNVEMAKNDLGKLKRGLLDMQFSTVVECIHSER